ncbi:MAG: hypothetical protein HYT15_02405 [Candidatus Magasanikbacteria bacterium]|nr:hypothetical protein [Candidatus Magasanikbacteria bacterium]
MKMKQTFLLLILLLILVAVPVIIFAADVAIDSSIHTTLTSHNGSSPTVVFISDQVGYAFFRDSAGTCAYSKTTDGGTSWGASVTVDSQTDCFKIAVWYDRWTPGDTSGTYIHITTMDAADIWYARLNTSDDTLTTVVNASGANQGGGFAVGSNIPSITKGTDGDVYMGVQDAGDSFVIKCVSGANCASAANWTEAGAIPFDLATDWLILMPLSSGNILAISWDMSADDVLSKVYNDSANSWDSSWATIDANAIEDGTYDAHFGATLKKSTGDIYLAYATDVATFGTDDDIRTAVYSGGAWTAKTDVLTNDSKGITGVKISFDESAGEIYAVYTARSTPGTAASGNVYWKKSTDGMATWGAEQGPVNVTAGDLYGARVNAMSNERIYVTWDLASTDDLMGDTIVDIISSDTTAPGVVSDLAASNPTGSSMDLSWTAPGDDGTTGTATSYDLRYSTSAITEGNFASATQVAGEPTPSAAGSSNSMMVTGLSTSTVYYFAIKTSDEVPNTSGISNVPSKTTLANGGPSPSAASSPSASGGSAQPRRVIFSGQAYPQSKIEVLRKLVEDETYIVAPSESSVINEDGSFVIIVTGLIRADYLFALRAYDKNGINSGALAFSVPFYVNLPGDLFEVKDILIPPTMVFEKALITKNDVLKIDGYALPDNVVELEVDGEKFQDTKATQSGFYNFNVDATVLAYGEHRAQVRQTTLDGKKSGFSTSRVFKLSKQPTLKTDFNNDGKVNINDWSIFLFQWGSDNDESRLKNDLSGDGKVNIFDFSIFLRAMNI